MKTWKVYWEGNIISIVQARTEWEAIAQLPFPYYRSEMYAVEVADE